MNYPEPDIRTYRARRLEIAEQCPRTKTADDLVAITDEHEDRRAARDPRQVFLGVLAGRRENGKESARCERRSCGTGRPIHHEPRPPGVADADQRGIRTAERLHADPHRVDDVRDRAVSTGIELVARIENRASTRDEVTEPRTVILRRVLPGAAVAVDEDDDAPWIVRGPEHPDLVRTLSVWPFPASCTRAATRDREKDEQNGRHGFRWTRHPRLRRPRAVRVGDEIDTESLHRPTTLLGETGDAYSDLSGLGMCRDRVPRGLRWRQHIWLVRLQARERRHGAKKQRASERDDVVGRREDRVAGVRRPGRVRVPSPPARAARLSG